VPLIIFRIAARFILQINSFPCPFTSLLITSLSNHAIILGNPRFRRIAFVAGFLRAGESEAPYGTKYCSRTTYHYGLGKSLAAMARANSCSKMFKTTSSHAVLPETLENTATFQQAATPAI